MNFGFYLSRALWIEKDALARIVYDVAKEYRVEVCPSRGYTSYSYLKSQIFRQRCGVENLVIRHLTDHDPSGLHMIEDLRVRAERYTGYKIPVERIALNIDQVTQFNLAPNPTKQADKRAREYKAKFSDMCWELDALPPDVLKMLVRQSIESLIDVDQWNRDVREQEKEREELRRTFEEYKKRLAS